MRGLRTRRAPEVDERTSRLALQAVSLLLGYPSAELLEQLPVLRRVADLPKAIRGSTEAFRGVLAKAPKPIQDTKVDMPTIGVATLQRAARAGLAGVVGEAGRLLVVDRDAVIAAADRVWGEPPLVMGVSTQGTIMIHVPHPAVMSGFGAADNNLHATNENMPIERYIQGIKFAATIFQEFDARASTPR